MQSPSPIFECEYEIIPPHDINGVGLLYFAAYPIIIDICATRYAGRAFATGFSTRRRDIFYFANSDADDTLIYRIHHWRADPQQIELEASLSRKSDGVLMAYAVASKDRVRWNQADGDRPGA
jgi:probable biosynthetic protein (TIGR04098 family)